MSMRTRVSLIDPVDLVGEGAEPELLHTNQVHHVVLRFEAVGYHWLPRSSVKPRLAVGLVSQLFPVQLRHALGLKLVEELHRVRQPLAVALGSESHHLGDDQGRTRYSYACLQSPPTSQKQGPLPSTFARANFTDGCSSL